MASTSRSTRIILVIAISALTGACIGGSPPVQSDPDSSAMPAASYKVFPATVPFGDSPKGWLRNEGNVPLEHEQPFFLEMSVDGEWISLQQPAGYSEGACDLSDGSFLLHPGESKSQKILACDVHGRIGILPPGEYRVTKVVKTVPSRADRTVVELTEVAEFTVAEPVLDVPEPSDCTVLCMSDTKVERGQTIRVSFDLPRRHIWSAQAELHAGTRRTVRPTAFLIGMEDTNELMTFWPEENFTSSDLGIRGMAVWKWVVPSQLDPGIYSIVKASSNRYAPAGKRHQTWTVIFNVTA